MRRVAPSLLLAVFTILALPLPASGNVPDAGLIQPESHALAAPGAWLTTFATPVVLLQPGGVLTFWNADAFLHDLVAYFQYGGGEDPWCARFPEGRCPVFWSEQIGTGEHTPVLGVDRLPKGTTHEFLCTIHPVMRGLLVVTDEVGA